MPARIPAGSEIGLATRIFTYAQRRGVLFGTVTRDEKTELRRYGAQALKREHTRDDGLWTSTRKQHCAASGTENRALQKAALCRKQHCGDRKSMTWFQTAI